MTCGLGFRSLEKNDAVAFLGCLQADWGVSSLKYSPKGLNGGARAVEAYLSRLPRKGHQVLSEGIHQFELDSATRTR